MAGLHNYVRKRSLQGRPDMAPVDWLPAVRLMWRAEGGLDSEVPQPSQKSPALLILQVVKEQQSLRQTISDNVTITIAITISTPNHPISPIMKVKHAPRRTGG